jgi:TRAP-type C4-dicarboxylate transport system permease small subunit
MSAVDVIFAVLTAGAVLMALRHIVVLVDLMTHSGEEEKP